MATGCSLVVLAGGQSRRMGRDKATLPAGTVTLVERIINNLSASADEVILASGSAALRLRGARTVADHFVGAGPLAGIHAGLTASAFDFAWVVACDYPDVQPAVGVRLRSETTGIDAVVPRVGGLAQGLCAVYSVRLVPVIERLIASGRRSVAALLDSCDVRYVDEDELSGPAATSFRNLNTPSDYEEWLRSML